MNFSIKKKKEIYNLDFVKRTGLTFVAAVLLFFTLTLMHGHKLTDAICKHRSTLLFSARKVLRVLQQTATVRDTHTDLRLTKRNLRLPKTQLKKMRMRNKSPDVPVSEARKNKTKI